MSKHKPPANHSWRWGYKAPTNPQLTEKQKRELEALTRKK